MLAARASQVYLRKSHSFRHLHRIMAAVFIYTCLPPGENALEPELMHVGDAGFMIDMRRLTAEAVDLSTPAAERPGLRTTISRLRAGDTLVVPRLTCLGSTISDVLGTLRRLGEMRVAVHCLEVSAQENLAAVDTPAAHVLKAVVAFERVVRGARVSRGLARARAEGRPAGRPNSLSPVARRQALARLVAGESVSEVARAAGTSRQTVLRIRDAAEHAGELLPGKTPDPEE
jgi:putative DNA-invertase from lambdoid prophage Rac